MRGPLGRLLLYCGQNSFDRDRHCSCRLALDGPRIVDIELDNLAGSWGRSHQRYALRRVEAMPGALRIDSQHSGAEREKPGRPVVADDLQGRSAVKDVDQLVAGEMRFP